MSGYFQFSGVEPRAEDIEDVCHRSAADGRIVIMMPDGKMYRLVNHMISVDGSEVVLYVGDEPFGELGVGAYKEGG